MTLERHITGCLLGAAVGDAIGLPREGMSARRAMCLFGGSPLGHRFIRSRGMCSDDTEHGVMVARALIASACDEEKFAKHLSRQLRWWLARCPAGIGWATLRACMKLWLGFRPSQSGVNSAGNGPAMRSALIGVVARDRSQLQRLVRASTRMTHTDLRAEQGAAVIALAAYLVVHEEDEGHDGAAIFRELADIVDDDGLAQGIEIAKNAVQKGVCSQEFAERVDQSNGVSGFVNHTVPAALFCWLSHRDSVRDAVESAVLLGGDTDTVAAIVGGLCGAELGKEAIPTEWLDGLVEWPQTVAWMKSLSKQLAESITSGEPVKPHSRSACLILLRNLAFTGIVLGHGLRRLLPPY